MVKKLYEHFITAEQEDGQWSYTALLNKFKKV